VNEVHAQRFNAANLVVDKIDLTSNNLSSLIRGTDSERRSTTIMGATAAVLRYGRPRAPVLDVVKAFAQPCEPCAAKVLWRLHARTAASCFLAKS
jgi:hypothetical protein